MVTEAIEDSSLRQRYCRLIRAILYSVHTPFILSYLPLSAVAYFRVIGCHVCIVEYHPSEESELQYPGKEKPRVGTPISLAKTKC